MTKGRQAEFGKRLFGRSTRLQVGMHFAATDHPTYLTELSASLQLPVSAVAEELKNLVELGMLRRDEVEGNRRVYYTRLDSAWWAVFEAAGRAIAASDAAVLSDSGGSAT